MKDGITVTNRRFVKLSLEQAMEFYQDRKNQEDYIQLVEDLSCGLILVMVYVKNGITKTWKDIVNFPTSKDTENRLAQIESKASAVREIRFFFPNTIMEPIPTKQYAKDYLSKNVIPTLLTGLTEVCRKKPKDPVIFLAEWLLQNNPNQPGTNELCPQIEVPNQESKLWM
ncbi:Nucleoside diphosphate kinase -like protein 5 [Echinococcus granulosus]|nr:Nucleoside diphosphate kinase -like protein 5 [Echinococcus granulosus]